jgi:hypothetical protein
MSDANRSEPVCLIEFHSTGVLPECRQRQPLSFSLAFGTDWLRAGDARAHDDVCDPGAHDDLHGAGADYHVRNAIADCNLCGAVYDGCFLRKHLSNAVAGSGGTGLMLKRTHVRNLDISLNPHGTFDGVPRSAFPPKPATSTQFAVSMASASRWALSTPVE